MLSDDFCQNYSSIYSKLSPQELGCIYMSPAHQSSILSSIKSIIFAFVTAFYAPPQKVAGYYVIPSELLSVCPSVCPSVRPSVRPSAVDHSCPLYNFDTVQDNFTKLGTNVKHDQTTCRDKQPSLHLHFLRNYSPLKFSV